MVSKYQSLKLLILEIVPLSKDAIHLYIGILAFLLTALVLRGRKSPFLWLSPGFLLSIMMEMLDLRDEFRSHGTLSWMESIHDVVNANVLPLLSAFVVQRIRKFKSPCRPPSQTNIDAA